MPLIYYWVKKFYQVLINKKQTAPKNRLELFVVNSELECNLT